MTKQQKGRLFRALKAIEATVVGEEETLFIPRDSLCLMLKITRKDKQKKVGFLKQERTISAYRIKLLVGQKVVWVETWKNSFYDHFSPATPRKND